MEHLIADTGIQFLTQEVEFNPAEPLVSGSKILKYSFCDVADFITGVRTFDLLVQDPVTNALIPLAELKDTQALELNVDGLPKLDFSGVQVKSKDVSANLFTNYMPNDSGVVTVNSLEGYRVPDPSKTQPTVSAFSLLLGKWLPMPVMEYEEGARVSGSPLGWCRVKIEEIGPGAKKGYRRYRLTWAFDTASTEDFLSDLRPCFYEGEYGNKLFKMCDVADLMLAFMSSDPNSFCAFSDYVSSLLDLKDKNADRTYIAFYTYLVNFLRVMGATPEVTLHKGQGDDIPVDLVLDMGNSRTCGVLFEDGDFTRAMMLSLRDMSRPHITYEKPFDMRFAFRKADFGNDIALDEEMFNYRSFVRVGDEAKRLVYRSLDEEGLSARTTNYSSPKRYLWDEKPYDGKWEFLITQDDPFHIKFSKNIYISGLSDLFDESGRYVGDDSDGFVDIDAEAHYSRSSLMTFVLIEVFQQAYFQINSIKFRNKHGNIDRRRVLRNIILTCPTAMPRREQIKLRQSAVDAYSVLQKATGLGAANIIPSVEQLKVTDKYGAVQPTWSYDEASCSQLVYLYAEIAQRYNGEINRFFEMKGHERPELNDDGEAKKSLTIGTIDIGAGTTDIMICAYESEGTANSRITPTPLFWDSFYLAGDDILRNIIQNLVIEGRDNESETMGNISSALTNRLLRMSNDDLMKLPCLAGCKVYADKVNDICCTFDDETRRGKIRAFASVLIHDFFGEDSSMMGYKDRRCRVDFNTQVSHPLSQFFLELLRLKRAPRMYRFDEIFGDNLPAAYLLDYFEVHFGFRFEELTWRFDPDEVAEIVKSTMEPLLKQMSILFYAYHCDVLILAGRPTSLDAITELFVKYIPVSPNRLVRLNEYRVGQWFPFADGQGYFYDQKAVVAVGAMVAYLASEYGFNGLSIDFGRMIDKMKSTASYMGLYNPRRQQVKESFMSPESNFASINVVVYPTFIGCRQFDSPQYQARPMYAIYNNSNQMPVRLMITRNFYEDREELTIDDAVDSQGNPVPEGEIEFVMQTLVNDGKHWLDKGEFELSII